MTDYEKNVCSFAVDFAETCAMADLKPFYLMEAIVAVVRVKELAKEYYRCLWLASEQGRPVADNGPAMEEMKQRACLKAEEAGGVITWDDNVPYLFDKSENHLPLPLPRRPGEEREEDDD